MNNSADILFKKKHTLDFPKEITWQCQSFYGDIRTLRYSHTHSSLRDNFICGI